METKLPCPAAAIPIIAVIFPVAGPATRKTLLLKKGERLNSRKSFLPFGIYCSFGAGTLPCASENCCTSSPTKGYMRSFGRPTMSGCWWFCTPAPNRGRLQSPRLARHLDILGGREVFSGPQLPDAPAGQGD